MTPRQMIMRSLRLLGVIGEGQTPNSEKLEDGLTTLTEMFDAWAGDNLLVPADVRTVFNITNGLTPHTLGVGGTFNTALPQDLTRVSIITNNNPLQPLELPLKILDEREWQQGVPVKNVASALPTRVYIEKTFPLWKLYYWPIPNVPNLQTALYLPTIVTTQPLTLDTPDFTFPKGYARAIRYNLALDLAPDYEIDPLPSVIGLAAQYLGDIRRWNIKPVTIVPDVPSSVVGGFFNYYTGEDQ